MAITILMSSIFSNGGLLLPGLNARALPAAHSAHEESFTIGNTTCFDLSRSAPMNAFITQLDQCHPHLIRIIGSLPGKEVVAAVRHQLVTALQQVDVGGLLIGGSETIKSNSNGILIDSIPGLAVPLQSLAYTSSLHGDVMKVFGTLPTNKDSIITEDSLDVLGIREPDMHVCMQRGLKRSLILPTQNSNVWMGEADGVVQAVESYLHHNPHARYTVILAGGGKATEHEYQETQSVLASQFGDRVQIITLAESGGFSSRVAQGRREGNLVPINFSSASLRERLEEFNRSIPRSERYDEQMALIEQQLKTITESRVLLRSGATNSSVSRETLNNDITQALKLLREGHLLEKLVRLADRIEVGSDPISPNGTARYVPQQQFADLAGELTKFHFADGWTKQAPGGQTAVAAFLLRTALEIQRETTRYAEKGAPQSSESDAATSGQRDLLDKLHLSHDPTADIPVGEIIKISGVTLAIALDEFGQRCLVGADGSVHPPQAVDSELLNIQGSLGQQMLSGLPLQRTPENIPSWTGIEEHGGIIRFKDIHGNILGHREILKVEQAKAEEGQIAKSVYRLITALDVTYEPPGTRLVRDIEHVNSLMFPPPHLPSACFVEVFPFSPAQQPETALPQQHTDRSLPTRTSKTFEPVQVLISQIEDHLIQQGIYDSVERIQYLSIHPTAESMSCLTGIDPVFEQSLERHRAQSVALREFKEITSTFLETALGLSPQNFEQVSRSILARSSIFTPLNKQLELFLEDLEKMAGGSNNLTMMALEASIRERGTRLLQALTSAEDHHQSHLLAIRHTRDHFPPDLAGICGEIAQKVTINFASGDAAEFRKLKSEGGSTTFRFTSDYFREGLQSGARLIEIYDKSQQKVVGFSHYFPCEAISAAQKANNPLLKNPGYGFYDLVCMDPDGGAPPTGSLIAIRSALIDLQYTDTSYLGATIHQRNEASMKSALRDRFAPATALDARIFTKQVGNGFESLANTWKCPVSPALRAALAPAQIDDRRERMAVINRVKAEAGGFLNATQEERRQMQWMAKANPESAFIRISVGVASMNDVAKADLQYLIDQGTFASVGAVFCLASNREASKMDAGWTLMERGPHEIMQRLKDNLHSDSQVIGIGTSDSRDPHFGKSIEVMMSDGTHQSFPIAYTETDDGSKVTLLDRRDIPVLLSPITFPSDYKGNLSIFHLEQLRAQEFSEMFNSSAFLFIGGGGVNAWYIKELTERVAQSPNAAEKVVLVTGFGGTTDKLAADDAWRSQYQQLIDQGKLVIINPMESEAERLKLQHLLEQVAAEAKA